MLTIRFIGFASASTKVRADAGKRADFILTKAVPEHHEVVVTGTTEHRRSTTAIQTISARQMREGVSPSIIDAITRMPGGQQIYTGPAVSKPVIRGLGFNRIITLSGGVRQEGQQWSDEHGIEIDDCNVSRAEVLKGPASLPQVATMAPRSASTGTGECYGFHSHRSTNSLVLWRATGTARPEILQS